MKKKVLLVGFQSASVDFEKWPGLSKEKLEDAFTRVEASLRAKGFEAVWCLTDTGETALDVLEKALQDHRPDIVSIGAGVRADPEHLRLFEAMVNLAHRNAPGATFAFNTDPMDTIESVERAARGGSSERKSDLPR